MDLDDVIKELDDILEKENVKDRNITNIHNLKEELSFLRGALQINIAKDPCELSKELSAYLLRKPITTLLDINYDRKPYQASTEVQDIKYKLLSR